MQSLICFVSDFGLDDTWVGVCHAVIHRACPQARVVDIAHHVPPFDIRQGAVTASAAVYQVPDAIHLVVVDPGVGPGRRDLCLTTRQGTKLVGPDNGVLLPAARRAGGARGARRVVRRHGRTRYTHRGRRGRGKGMRRLTRAVARRPRGAHSGHRGA